MDTCIECGDEISPAEGYYNNNMCNACAFGLPEDVCKFGGAQAEHQIGTIDDLTHEARLLDESEETAEFVDGRALLAGQRAAVADMPSYVERCKIDERALAEVTAFYSGHAPEAIRSLLSDYLASGDNMRAIVFQYREALRKLA